MKRPSLFESRMATIAGAVLVLLVSSITTFGQGGTTVISGTVRDQQENVVAGATVTLSNAEKNFSRNACR